MLAIAKWRNCLEKGGQVALQRRCVFWGTRLNRPQMKAMVAVSAVRCMRLTSPKLAPFLSESISTAGPALPRLGFNHLSTLAPRSPLKPRRTKYVRILPHLNSNKRDRIDGGWHRISVER